MKVSQLIVSALTLISLVTINLGSSVSEARDRVDRRQTNQNLRVREGVRSNEITASELARLQASKRIVRRAERRAEVGGVTEAEALKLEKMQDARSRQINRLKNNDKAASDGQ